MDPFNSADTYPHLTAEWPNSYQSMCQLPATEANNQAYDNSTGGWDVWEQPEPMAGPSTSQWNATNYERLVPATWQVGQTYGYSQPSYFANHLPTVHNQPQLQYSGFLNQGGSLPNAVASGTGRSGIISPDHWGENQSGPSTSTSHTWNMQPSYQPGPGPTRIRSTSVGRHRPYATYHARLNVRGNMEAGPSAPAHPRVPYTAPPTPQPSGRIPESTADAENTTITTEEDQAPTSKRASKRTKHSHSEGSSRLDRRTRQTGGRRMCELVQSWLDLRHRPILNEALEVAVRIIPVLREREYQKPRIRTMWRERTIEGQPDADLECRRRDEERRLFGELSQYYPLEEHRTVWDRASLLLHIMCDLETIDKHKTSGGGYSDPVRMEGVERALDDIKPLFSAHFNEASVVESISAACAEVRSEDGHTQNSQSAAAFLSLSDRA